MKEFKKLAKLSPGDKVAIISPSADMAGRFPWVLDLGLQRLKDDFQLVPVEYPTTRGLNNSLQERARDVMAAFADKESKAVFTTIGGNDQIRLLKYLDKQVFLENPKPFFGYSDNGHLHNFLWSLGIPSYYGGAVMNQLGMNVKMFESTAKSLKRALFESGEFELEESSQYTDVGIDWSEKDNLNKPRPLDTNTGLVWDGDIDAAGKLWGGCVESLIVQSSTGIYLPKDQDLEGTILYLETAEDIPEHWVIEYLLTGFGERGWLDKFQAVLIGRPKAWEFNKQNSTEQKIKYTKDQQDTILRTIRFYNQTIPVVQNLDFGHTDPQVILPNGGHVRVVTSQQKIFLTY